MHQSHAHRNQFRRLNIATGIVRGKSLAAIAREEGVSRQTISKQAASSDVQQIVVTMVRAAPAGPRSGARSLYESPTYTPMWIASV